MAKTSIWRFISAAILALVLGSGPPPSGQGTVGDPFEFFAPTVVVSEVQRQRLERDEPVVQTLRGGGGQLAVFVATRLDAPADALVAWTRRIAQLKQSRFVLEIGRFSDPPTPADLDKLSLDERDLEAIRECRPADCALKLSAPEIESLKSAAESGGKGWHQAVEQEFRRLVVARVNLYRTAGLNALPPTHDRSTPNHLEKVFASILAKSPYLERLPNVERWLKNYPDVTAAGIESFFYWSKEQYGRGKPVISVTHVGIVHTQSGHNLPAVVVVGKQILATHYVEGALGLTMVIPDSANGTSYLVYLNRSQLDLLKGPLSGVFRSAVEQRLERNAPEVVRGLRTRLESGLPPDQPPATHSTPVDEDR
jgi:hypothetical protein